MVNLRLHKTSRTSSLCNAVWARLHAHSGYVRLEQSQPQTCVLRNPDALQGMYLGRAPAAWSMLVSAAIVRSRRVSRCLVRAFGGYAGSRWASISRVTPTSSCSQRPGGFVSRGTGVVEGGSIHIGPAGCA